MAAGRSGGRSRGGRAAATARRAAALGQRSQLIAAPVCLFFGLVVAERWLRTSRYTFDQETRHLRYRLRFSWPQERPLDGVLAVQVLAGEVYSSDEGPDYQQYQLNIVLDDAALPRLNVSNHPDLDWTRAGGRQLADFLGIPLLDHVS